VAKTEDIRNIVLVGHGGSGKTSLAEAMLHITGTINRLGNVDSKSSTCDYLDEEKEHQHSIQSAVIHVNFGGKVINIIDTPGYPDFIGPSISSIPGADTAIIVISAASGIETITRKVFESASENKMAKLIVINKIDSDNIDLPVLIKNIQETFGSTCRCANLPASEEGAVVDCIKNDSGQSPLMDVSSAHTELIENVIEADDELMESYLGGEEIKPERIASVFVKALTTGTLIPIVFTDARHELGIKELLEIITKYTPSPAESNLRLVLYSE
jgi:elongation factor G